MDRHEIAIKAAQERWNPTIPKASHSGTLIIGEVSIPCAVVKMPDGTIVRLLTQRGMTKALGKTDVGRSRKGAGNSLIFVAADNLKPFIPNALMGADAEPIEFRLPTGGKALGYRAELLPMICGVYLDAQFNNKLLPSQKKVADISNFLLKAFSNIGLVSLVDEVCGYQKIRDSDALQKILEKYVNTELAKWAARFPPEFYQQIYRLRNWAWNSAAKTKYSIVGHYTKDLVYERLHHGILEEMERVIPRKEDGTRKGKYHQLLTDDYGIPKLKEHFSALLAVMKLSKTWDELIANVNIVLPKTIEFEERKDIPQLPAESVA